MANDRFANLPPKVRNALQEWQRLHPDGARQLERFDRAQERNEGRWNHRRQVYSVEDRSEPATTPAVKAALEEAINLRSKWAQAQRDLQAVAKQLDEISKDQQRLRANLKELPPTAAAYKRYLEKFDAQETQIEKLQADQKRLLDVEHAARTKLEQYLQNLSVA